MQCLITGCAFYDPYVEAYAWGDLYEEGDCLMFHAMVDGHRRIRWNHSQPDPNLKAVRMVDNHPYYERGETIVVARSRTQLSESAVAYLSL